MPPEGHEELEQEALDEAENQNKVEPEEEEAMAKAGETEMMGTDDPMKMMEDPEMMGQSPPDQLESEEEMLNNADADQNHYPAGEVTDEEKEALENLDHEQDFEGNDPGTGEGDAHSMVMMDQSGEKEELENFKKISNDCKKHEAHFRDCLDEIPPESWTKDEMEKCVGKDFSRIVNYMSNFLLYFLNIFIEKLNENLHRLFDIIENYFEIY